LRVDKLLWFLRFTNTRPLAQTLAEDGHIRLNGRRVARGAQAVSIGDVLVLPLPQGVQVIQILALPARRGPAAEAMTCYRTLDERGALPIAAASNRIGPHLGEARGQDHQGDHLP
jgi:ribosome-associated heat shock protein Hsp15